MLGKENNVVQNKWNVPKNIKTYFLLNSIIEELRQIGFLGM